MAKRKAKSPTTKLPSTHFAIWLTLPKSERAGLRSAAGTLDLPMSEFARRAVQEAVRRVEAGESPFATGDDK